MDEISTEEGLGDQYIPTHQRSWFSTFSDPQHVLQTVKPYSILILHCEFATYVAGLQITPSSSSNKAIKRLWQYNQYKNNFARHMESWSIILQLIKPYVNYTYVCWLRKKYTRNNFCAKNTYLWIWSIYLIHFKYF